MVQWQGRPPLVSQNLFKVVKIAQSGFAKQAIFAESAREHVHTSAHVSSFVWRAERLRRSGAGSVRADHCTGTLHAVHVRAWSITHGEGVLRGLCGIVPRRRLCPSRGPVRTPRRHPTEITKPLLGIRRHYATIGHDCAAALEAGIGDNISLAGYSFARRLRRSGRRATRSERRPMMQDTCDSRAWRPRGS